MKRVTVEFDAVIRIALLESDTLVAGAFQVPQDPLR